MREIKFRCWDKKTNKYIEDVHIYLDGNFREFGDDDGGKSGMWEHDCSKNENLILEQYTGLKDKNGKEIYEGDIIILRSLHDSNAFDMVWNNKTQEGIPQVISVSEEPPYNFILPSDSGYNPGYWEVIGNIYEHKELLNGE